MINAGAALLHSFDHVYLINLRDRRDRRAQSEAQLQRIGLSFDHPAVTLFAATRPTEAAGFPSLGARGCFQSHRGVLAAALAAGYRSFVVLEDDVDLSPAFATLMPAFDAALAARTWHMAYGFDPNPGSHRGVRLVPPAEPVQAAHFLGFRQEAAARLLPYLDAILLRPAGDPAGGPMHVDGAYCRFRAAHPDLVTLASVEPLAVQRSSRSDITPVYWVDRVPGLRRAADGVRALRARLRG